MRPTFIATLAALLGACLIALPATAATTPKTKPAAASGIFKLAVAPGVSLDDAAESMRLRANKLNLKLVAELPLSKQVEADTGQPQRVITIFQFCDAVTARNLIDQTMDFAVYVPCRIALIEDKKGQGWLVMMDIDVDALAKEKGLQKDLKARIEKVRDGLIEIMQAGAKGDL